MNNFEHILSLSPNELADFWAETFCVYPDRDNCGDSDCSACILRWLNEKHNGSGLTEYEKMHSTSLKKFAKDYAHMICLRIAPNDEACVSNPLCMQQPFICAYKWLNREYQGKEVKK